MKAELKRWKDRVDALLSSSDNGAEWNKIKAEAQEAQEKTQELTDMINELRKNLADSSSKLEQTNKEFEAFRTQAALDKSKSLQDNEQLRTEKTKREEMFKSLINELKDIVIIIQKELHLKEIDWNGKGGVTSITEKLKLIKEELASFKILLKEKIQKDKDESVAKQKQIVDITNESSLAQKKIEEIENKLKEKETRIGQMNNFISTTKTRMQTQKKTIDDLNKELSDLKQSNTAAASAASATVAASSGSSDPNKAKFDSLRSQLLQSKYENERFKKELETTNSALIEAYTKLRATGDSTAIISNIQSTAEHPTTLTSILASKTTSPQQTQANSAVAPSNIANAEMQQSQQSSQSTPTAYITPSRITKVLLDLHIPASFLRDYETIFFLFE
jgi:hypothetical protein